MKTSEILGSVLPSLLVIVGLLVSSCNGGSSEVTQPDPNPPNFQLAVSSPDEGSAWFVSEAIAFDASVLVDGTEADVAINWTSSIDGPIQVINGIANLSAGVHSLSVSATYEGVSLTRLYPIAVVDESPVIEALILGSGQMAVEPSGCPRPDEWTTWAQGSEIAVNLPSTLPEEKTNLVQQFAEDVVGLSSQSLNVAVNLRETVSDELVSGAINVIESDRVDCPNGFACALPRFNNDNSVDAYIIRIHTDQPAQVLGHELGHALMGLCHIEGSLVLPGNSMMSAPTEQYYQQSSGLPTRLDALAFQSVFFSGLPPGADRDDLKLAGVL